MRSRLLFFAGLFASLCVAFAATTAEPPSFCYGWECPAYQVLNQTDSFEIRRYETATWISFSLTINDTIHQAYIKAITEGSFVLSQYRGGLNAERVELNVTVPMRVFIADASEHEPEDVARPFEFIISYFLPSAAQKQPPRPLDERLCMDTISEATLAVRAFEHGATSWEYVRPDLVQLKADLESSGMAYQPMSHVVFMYDRRAHHSEIALFMEPAPAPTPAPSPAAMPAPAAGDHPDFCGESDCPKFELTRSTRTYEVRQYAQAKWAVFNVTLEGSVADNYGKAVKMATPVLLGYRKKGNVQEAEMAHTVPMLVAIDDRDKNADTTCFRFAYFIPFKYQDDVPEPLDKRIEIMPLGPVSLAVRTFTGFIVNWDKHVMPELDKLKQDLDSHGEKYLAAFYGVAQYDPIWKITDRHNEVALWLDGAEQLQPKPAAVAPSVALTAAPAVQSPATGDHPDFCGESDCPKFELTRSTRTYEVRQYAQANWAVFNVTLEGSAADNYGKAIKIAAPVLLGYRKKGNLQEVEMAHTVPMVVTIDTQDDGSTCFRFAYFIPFQFQDNVPEPNDKRIEIMCWGPVSLAVRVFSGFVVNWDKHVVPEVDKLKQDLDSHGERYSTKWYGVAQYDPIWKISDRHNEIMLMLDGAEQLQSMPVPAAPVSPSRSAILINGHSNDDDEADGEEEEEESVGTAENAQFVPPAFCHEHDCPDFDVVRSGKSFEVRNYKAAKWLAYNVTSHKPMVEADQFKKVIDTGIQLIHDYNNGHNEHGIKVPVTVPITVFARERYGPNRDQVLYVVAFYIPVKFQSAPPLPLDPLLSVQEMPEGKLAVRGFRAFSRDWDSTLLPQVDKLAVDLSKAGEHYKRDHTFISFYNLQNPPHSPYSEAWLLVEDK